jgi:hypothetical protein
MKHRFAETVDADCWRREVYSGSGRSHEIIVRSVSHEPTKRRFLERESYVVSFDDGELPEQYSARDEAFEDGYFALGDVRQGQRSRAL